MDLRPAHIVSVSSCPHALTVGDLRQSQGGSSHTFRTDSHCEAERLGAALMLISSLDRSTRPQSQARAPMRAPRSLIAPGQVESSANCQEAERLGDFSHDGVVHESIELDHPAIVITNDAARLIPECAVDAILIQASRCGTYEHHSILELNATCRADVLAKKHPATVSLFETEVLGPGVQVSEAHANVDELIGVRSIVAYGEAAFASPWSRPFGWRRANPARRSPEYYRAFAISYGAWVSWH